MKHLSEALTIFFWSVNFLFLICGMVADLLVRKEIDGVG